MRIPLLLAAALVPFVWAGPAFSDAPLLGTGPSLAISGSCPDSVDLDMSGMSANRVVAVAYSLGAGTSTLNRGSCAGITLDLAQPHQVGGILQADGSGNVSLTVNIPANACGNLTFQALDIRTCTLTNTASI